MFLAFPLLTAYCLIEKKVYPEATYKYVSTIIGFLLASLYSFFDLFFTSAYYLTPHAFFSNFLHSLVADVLLPFLICGVFLFILVHTYRYKWHELFYILLGFFCVYFPARTLNINAVLGWYELFIKPIVMICAIIGIKNCIVFLYQYVEKPRESLKKHVHVLFCISISFAFLLCLIALPVIEAFYMLGSVSWILIPVSLLISFGIIYGSSVAVKKVFA